MLVPRSEFQWLVVANNLENGVEVSWSWR